jgi:hypothetical protein
MQNMRIKVLYLLEYNVLKSIESQATFKENM